MNEKKKKLNINVILIGAVFVLALGAFAWQYFNKTEGGTAVVYVKNMYSKQATQHEISLSEDGIHNIDDGMFPVTLEVKNGGIRFINSQCPDHVCEGFGFIRYENASRSCLPAGVTVIIDTQSDETAEIVALKSEENQEKLKTIYEFEHETKTEDFSIVLKNNKYTLATEYIYNENNERENLSISKFVDHKYKEAKEWEKNK